MWSISEREQLNPASAAEIVQAAVCHWHGKDEVHTTTPTEGLAVTATFPGVSVDAMQHWLGRRLIVWPRGVCPLKPVAVLSSHLGKRPDQHPWWFDLLRTIAIRVDETECLCSVSSTAADEAVNRCSELFQIPRLVVEIEDSEVDECSLQDWLVTTVNKQLADDDEPSGDWHALISPKLSQLESNHQVDQSSDVSSLPVADRVLLVAGQRLYVAGCRRNGKVFQCLQQFDRMPPRGDSTHVLAAQSDGIPRPFQNYQTSPRIVPWIVSGLTDSGQDEVLADKAGALNANTVRNATTNWEIDNSPSQSPDQWLSHWTRPRHGKWPEQHQNEFLDELILGAASANRSALAALLRIIDTQRLLASGEDDRMTVSFTEVPLAEFRQRRVFRGHRSRYDFEPWGIAVRRSVIEQLGGRPVIYGDEHTRQSLNAEDAVFFQPATTASGNIDWTQEREWRVCGHIDLSEMASEDIMIFVDTVAQQKAVQARTGWAVMCLPADESSGHEQ